MINFSGVTLRRGTRVLFESVSFTLRQGEKIGITGANGAGKSSLFSLLLDRLHADAGDVSMPPNLEVAHVAQEIPNGDGSAIDYVLDGDGELRRLQRDLADSEHDHDAVRVANLHARLEAIGGYDAPARAAKLLRGLGFAPGEELRAVTEFSGGWRMRLNLAHALMCRSDLLLLDEPTNHLDLDAVIWLQEWLSRYPGTLLLISHDRDFLDELVERVMHIEHQSVVLHTGNYSAFERYRAESLQQQQAAFSRQQREVERIRSFVDRFRAQATKARQVQSRLKALDRMELVARAQADSPFRFVIAPPDKLPSPLLKLDEAAVGYGATPTLSALGMTINPGDRLGLLGPNGAGKTTLVKLLAGELPPSSGIRLPAQDLRIGYFAQHQLEQLRPDDSPLRHFQRLDPKAMERDLRNFIGGFGFSGDRAMEAVADFSGGEKARLVLALLIYQRPNLLLLDEPTNHLDLGARDALALALQDFPGALLLVSHDRYLLRSVCDDYWLIADGAATPFSGDLEEYRLWLNRRRAVNRDGAAQAKAADNRRSQRRSDAEIRKLLRPFQQAVERAEAALAKLDQQRAELEQRLADPTLYEASAKEQLQKAILAKAELEKRASAAENDWLNASEALENAQREADSPSESAA